VGLLALKVEFQPGGSGREWCDADVLANARPTLPREAPKRSSSEACPPLGTDARRVGRASPPQRRRARRSRPESPARRHRAAARLGDSGSVLDRNGRPRQPCRATRRRDRDLLLRRWRASGSGGAARMRSATQRSRYTDRLICRGTTTTQRATRRRDH